MRRQGRSAFTNFNYIVIDIKGGHSKYPENRITARV